MKLEGTLDAFSLPDIFQLLSYTKKTGTLHLHRGAEAHGAVHLRDGVVTGGRTDVDAQELSRRLLGTGLVDDEALASAAEALASDPSLSLARLLVEKAEVDAASVTALAVEQVTDTVFSLLRWPDGSFSFVVDEATVADLGARVPVDEVVAEGQRRLAAWASMVEHVPPPDAVLVVEPAPPGGDVATSRDEWSLLALVDGHRTVAELVVLSGRGEYAVVSALAGLVSRGLLAVGRQGGEQLVRRQSLLAALEGRPVEEPPAPPAPVAPTPARRAGDAGGAPTTTSVEPGPVIPERREPFTPARRPDHPEQAAPPARTPVTTASAAGGAPGGAHGSVHGATAMKPDAVAGQVVERDPSINKSLLLRLIAGVRGL